MHTWSLAAYRQAALLVHPDRCNDDRAEVAFVYVQAAQEALLDVGSRAELDMRLEALAGREEAEAPAEQYGWWGAPVARREIRIRMSDTG